LLTIESNKVTQSLQEGLQWLHQVMPNVEPKLVGGLIDSIANGSYNITEDLITLSKDFANKGVVKEEAFHRLWEKMTPSKNEVENILKQKIDNGEITFTNEDGKPCAQSGLTTNINGTNWKIVEDLKGNSHKFGGIDITLSDDGVSFKSNNSYIKAKHGLLIINNN